MKSKSGGDRRLILSRTVKIVIAKNLGEKSVNQEAHLKIACCGPSCIPHHHPQVHEEEFECFEQKIVAKRVRANFSAGPFWSPSSSHRKKDHRMVWLQLGLLLVNFFQAYCVGDWLVRGRVGVGVQCALCTACLCSSLCSLPCFLASKDSFACNLSLCQQQVVLMVLMHQPLLK